MNRLHCTKTSVWTSEPCWTWLAFLCRIHIVSICAHEIIFAIIPIWATVRSYSTDRAILIGTTCITDSWIRTIKSKWTNLTNIICCLIWKATKATRSSLRFSIYVFIKTSNSILTRWCTSVWESIGTTRILLALLTVTTCLAFCTNWKTNSRCVPIWTNL